MSQLFNAHEKRQILNNRARVSAEELAALLDRDADAVRNWLREYDRSLCVGKRKDPQSESIERMLELSRRVA